MRFIDGFTKTIFTRCCDRAHKRNMATISPSKITTKLGGVSRSPPSYYTQLTFCIRQPIRKATTFRKSPAEPLLSPRKRVRTCPAADNDQAAAQEAANRDTSDDATAAANGSLPQAAEPAAPKRPPLTARERLRAARVLGKYAEPGGAKGSSKTEFGSRVLDALRETDKGKKKKRSGLPEAPTNLFDDSKRGLPKEGWTFELPVGTDVLVIAASFVLITTVMLGTTYLVWKLGAIHFNEF